MQTDSIELGFLSIFALITFFVFLIISKYSYKISNGVLMDDDFNKPQAFHHEVVSQKWRNSKCDLFTNIPWNLLLALFSSTL